MQIALLQILLFGQSDTSVVGFVAADTDILKEIPPTPAGQLEGSHLSDPPVQWFLTAVVPVLLGRSGVNVLGRGVKPFPWLCSCSLSPGCLGFLCCWLTCSTCHVLPLHPGARSVQPRASGDECFIHGSLERPFLPLAAPRAYQISSAPSPFAAAAPATTWFSPPNSSKSSPLEPQLCALLLA